MRIPDTTTTTREFGPCLACDKPITATAEIEITGLRIDGRVGTASVKMVGISVSHDCRTKATDEPTTAPAACDREHDDDWVEVDEWPALPKGTRIRNEWALGSGENRRFVHRDDLPDTTQKETP